jgi:hypothetical protein
VVEVPPVLKRLALITESKETAPAGRAVNARLERSSTAEMLRIVFI